jgi:ferredoxin
MQRPVLRKLRIVVAATLFTGLAFALLGPHGRVPETIGRWLASTQFVPSLLVLVAGASLSLACILIVVVTLLVGRVYCSAICPLGISQDIIARIAAFVRRRKAVLPFTTPQTGIRQLFLWGTVGAILLGWGGFAVALLDPYGNFGRIVSILFRPLVTVADRAAVGVAHLGGLSWPASPTNPWGGIGVIAVPAAILSLLVVLAVFRGRLYCNTICPVGTLLGLFSRSSAYRITIEKSACLKCGECLRACKAQCIDLRKGAIDYSRCVACYNCLGVCENHSVGYRFSWKRNIRSETPVPAAPVAAAKPLLANTVPDPQRRTFLATAAAAVVASIAVSKLHAEDDTAEHGPENEKGDKLIRPISPPGSVSIEHFLARCVGCQLCVGACATNALQPSFSEYGLGGLSKPRLDYSKGFCDFDCRRCGEVCPSGAIGPLELAEKQVTRIGVVHLEAARCVVQASGTACTACSDKCPTKAVRSVPFSAGLRLPEIQPLLCIGCGTCEHVCPAKPKKAITVIGRRHHNRARKAAEGHSSPAAASAQIISPAERSTKQIREPAIVSAN